jgi:mono/diheme cytochrome c family protein
MIPISCVRTGLWVTGVLLSGVLVGALFSVALTGCQGRPGANDTSQRMVPPPDDDMSRGATVFAGQCAMCHQPGQSMNGMDKLAPKSKYMKDKLTFIAFLRKPGNGMPPFPPEQLSDADAESLYTYIRDTFVTPKPDATPKTQ